MTRCSVFPIVSVTQLCLVPRFKYVFALVVQSFWEVPPHSIVVLDLPLRFGIDRRIHRSKTEQKPQPHHNLKGSCITAAGADDDEADDSG